MLPKVNRIRKRKDFEIIFRRSKGHKNIIHGEILVFKTAKNDLGVNRFGFVVSQKVSKKATVRNKIRRRLSEMMKAETENIKAGTDMILIALPGIEEKEFSEIKEVIHKTCSKL